MQQHLIPDLDRRHPIIQRPLVVLPDDVQLVDLMEGLPSTDPLGQLVGHVHRAYRRTLSDEMLRWLVGLVEHWRAEGRPLAWHAVEGQRSGDYAKLGGFWGVVRPAAEGEGQAGEWVPLPHAMDFVDGDVSLPRYVLVFGNRVIDFTGVYDGETYRRGRSVRSFTIEGFRLRTREAPRG